MLKLDWKAVVAAGGVALLVLYLVERQTREAASAVGAAINPVSDQNVFYQGANAVTQAVTGDQSTSLGSWLYDFVHGE